GSDAAVRVYRCNRCYRKTRLTVWGTQNKVGSFPSHDGWHLASLSLVGSRSWRRYPLPVCRVVQLFETRPEQPTDPKLWRELIRFAPPRIVQARAFELRNDRCEQEEMRRAAR